MTKLSFPTTWNLAKLGDVTEIIGGGTPSRVDETLFRGEIPWATPSDITKLKDIWIDETREYITKEGLAGSSAQLLPTGTVLMTSRATIGVTAIIRKPMSTNQGFANFICDEQVLFNQYLAYWLPAIKEQLIRLAGGTTFKEISRSTLARVAIPLPPIEEQQRIVTILKQADQLRRLRREVNEKIKLLYASLFRELFGSGSANAKHSQTVKLCDLLDVPLTSGFSPSETNEEPPGIPVFTLNALTDLGLDEHIVKYHPVEAYSGRGSDLKKNDILITRSNTQELVGKVGRYRGQPSPVIYPDLMIRIRLKEPGDSAYVEGFLRSQAIGEVIKRMARGTSGSMKKISQGDINEFDILWPSDEYRQAYIKQIEWLDQQQDRSRASAYRLELLFQSLLSRAFTGELTATWRTWNGPIPAHQLHEHAPVFEIISSQRESEAWRELKEQRPALLEALSDDQRALLQELLQAKGYFTLETVSARKKFSYLAVRQGLQIFSQMGLIQAIRLPDHPTQGVVIYVLAYRALTDEDQVREVDLAMLQREIDSNELGFDYTEEEIAL